MTIRTASNRIQYTSYDMPYSLETDYNMDAIGRCLDMRYLESVREKEGGSYGVGTYGFSAKRPTDKAVLLMQFDTDPEKQEKLMQIIHKEVEEMAQNGPLDIDLQKAKESMLKDFEEDKEKNNYWDNDILPAYYLWGNDEYTGFVERVKGITKETVKATLNKLLESGNMFEVVMYPAD